MMADLHHLLAIYVHAHQTGNSVPPHIDAEARTALAEPKRPPNDLEIDALVHDCLEEDGYSLRVIIRAALARYGYRPLDSSPPADGEVARLVAWLEEEADDYECIGCEDSAAKCNRAAELLQRQAPVQPADGEVAELVAWLRSNALTVKKASGNPANGARQRMNRAAELLQRQAPLPVAVSERLPEPSDCAPWPDEPAASAWCWVGSDVDGGWSWEQRSAGCLAAFPDDFTHWLPAHALPLPEVGE